MKELKLQLRLWFAEWLLLKSIDLFPEPEKIELQQAFLPVMKVWIARMRQEIGGRA